MITITEAAKRSFVASHREEHGEGRPTTTFGMAGAGGIMDGCGSAPDVV